VSDQIPTSAGGRAAADAVISVRGLSKIYKGKDHGKVKGKQPQGDFQALDGIDLDIKRGEIFALLGPNGAGKTTLINIICGIVNPTAGTVTADGHDIIREARAARKAIGLVPQELAIDAFEKVWNVVRFSRGLFGKPANPAFLEKVLTDLALWDKKDNKVMTLSGGMKRRVLIAKALSHEPTILFLDEPTAGVDVELRRSMWEMVRKLRAQGVTIILTTHYIEEAEEMADRIGVINKGKLILVEEKATLIQKMGKKAMTLALSAPIAAIPAALAGDHLTLSPDGDKIVYTFDAKSQQTGVGELFQRLSAHGIQVKDVQTKQSSLEDIFVDLVGGS
jgi:ABC-2 type transport system ATP-binding protein